MIRPRYLGFNIHSAAVVQRLRSGTLVSSPDTLASSPDTLASSPGTAFRTPSSLPSSGMSVGVEVCHGACPVRVKVKKKLEIIQFWYGERGMDNQSESTS